MKKDNGTLSTIGAAVQFGIELASHDQLTELDAAKIMAQKWDYSWADLDPSRQSYWRKRARRLLKNASYRVPIYDEEGPPRVWKCCKASD